MSKKYWAQRHNSLCGPHATREEAIDAFRDIFPFDGPDYQAFELAKDFHTGFGEYGPHFDIRFHKIRVKATDAKQQEQQETGE